MSWKIPHIRVCSLVNDQIIDTRGLFTRKIEEENPRIQNYCSSFRLPDSTIRCQINDFFCLKVPVIVKSFDKSQITSKILLHTQSGETKSGSGWSQERVYKGVWVSIDVCECKRVISKLFVESLFIVKSLDTPLDIYYSYIQNDSCQGFSFGWFGCTNKCNWSNHQSQIIMIFGVITT